MERINTYLKWVEQENIPLIRGHCVPDLMSVSLDKWSRKGGFGAYILLVDWDGILDAYLCEIPPGQSLKPQKHMYEELIYILSGYGSTTVWNEGGKKQNFDWHEGSTFAPPLNSWHQHFNNQTDKSVRYIAGTQAPLIMNVFNNLDFIFNNNYVFTNRFSGEEGYFSGHRTLLQESDSKKKRNIWKTNFLSDCRTIELPLYEPQGTGARKSHFEFSNGTSSPLIDEIPPGRYKIADYHAGGAMAMAISGLGYSLIWPSSAGPRAEGVERTKIDWKPYTLFAYPDGWYHQHFNPGNVPARLMQFQVGKSFQYIGIHKEFSRKSGIKSVKEGGFNIMYSDEDPAIRRQFKEELKKTGATYNMGHIFPNE